MLLLALVMVAAVSTCLAQEDYPLFSVIIHAEYKGGEKALNEFIENNLVTPVNNTGHDIHDTVLLQFVIDKKGCVEQIEVVSQGDLGDDFVQSAIYVVQKMNCNWTPANYGGKPMGMRFLLPIEFNVEAESPSKKRKKKKRQKIKSTKYK